MDEFHTLSLPAPRQLHEGGSAGRPVSRVLSRSPLAKRTATVISLAGRLPARSSSLPESRDGPGQPVTRLLVGSYIKELALPHHFTLTRSQESGVRSQESGKSGLAVYVSRY